jgi:Polyketide cyclase / dehydrase and lipid transport
MITIDRSIIKAAPDVVWPLAVQIEQWPRLLSHYRWVTRQSGVTGGGGIVEMAAWRPFGAWRWPTWWRSEMTTDAALHRITYRHIGGITTGMDVLWTINPTPEGWSDVTIVHEWSGPRWPVIGGVAAEMVIGPVFVHGIASRTLAGIANAAEAAS